MKITNVIGSVQDKVNEVGARAMLAASNAAGRAMNTKLGRAALVLPMAVSACTITASAEGADAQGMIDAIMAVDPNVVNSFIRSGALYQDTKGNAVFLHRENGKPCGAEIHGTSGKSYTVGNAKYSDFAEDRKVIPTEPYIAEIIGRELTDSGVKFAGYVYEQNANIVTDNAGYSAMLG